jgi:hypothetical protein
VQVNFPFLQEKVKVLNKIAGEGKALVRRCALCSLAAAEEVADRVCFPPCAVRAQIVETGGVHRLKIPDGIPFTVFKNGFMLRRGPFRPYSDAPNQAFVADILDGYFPLEFKEEFPDGVIFDLRDRSNDVYSAETFNAFSGAGVAVGESRVRAQLTTRRVLSRLLGVSCCC